MLTYDPLRVAVEIREQLASDRRRIGFLFGAGTSMAVTLPGIEKLTSEVESKIGAPLCARMGETVPCC